MCVAVAVPANASWPKPEELFQMEEANKHGGGLAWVQDNKVIWKKGLKATEIIKLLEKIKPPALIHFRIASTGGENPLLCHPFPITPEVSLKLEGCADSVLIHNGHWGPWDQHLLHMAPFYCSGGKKLPSGPWTDTRAMAFIAAVYGEVALGLLDEKVAVLKKDGTIAYYGYWQEKSGCQYSNLSWERKWTKKDEKNFRAAWGKGDDYYGCTITKPEDTNRASNGTSADPSRSTYLSKEAEEANNAVVLSIKKTEDPKSIALAVYNDLQIVNG